MLLESQAGRDSRGREVGRATVIFKENAKRELYFEVSATAATVDGQDDGPFDEGTAAFRAGREAQAEYERLREIFPMPANGSDV
jgi:hypothetical protein